MLEILIFSLLNFGCYNRHRSYGTHLMIQKYEFRIPKVLDNYNIFLFSILHQLNVLYQSCQKDVRPSKMDALLYLLAQEGHNLHRMGKRILNHSRRSRIWIPVPAKFFSFKFSLLVLYTMIEMHVNGTLYECAHSCVRDVSWKSNK